MFDEPRKSLSLKILEVLNKRKPLSMEQLSTYRRLASGYAGEMKFAARLKKEFRNHCIPLFSLNLEVNGSECQIDNLLIFQNVIFLLDIKNFEGDYVIDSNQWYSALTGKERKNPLHQLKRATIIFQDFLSKCYFQGTVDSSLVFVHPGFHLYQASPDHPIIFPSQLHRFIQRLNNIPSQLDKRQDKLAKQLMHAHIPKSKHEEVPTYGYNQLKRGIVCGECDGFMVFQHSRRLICQQCGVGEQVDRAVLRMIAEFHLLFPNEEITVRSVHHWCNRLIPLSGVRRILSINLTMKQKGRSSHYIFEQK
jgi:hypothetical protein